MKFFLFILISILLPISTLQTHALTQAEALEQVKNMDEKEYVERSLKTILYLRNAAREQEDKKYSEKDNFLPLELYLGYDIQTLYDKFNTHSQDLFYDEIQSKIYTKGLKIRVDKFFENCEENYNEKLAKEYRERDKLCDKLLGYKVDSFSCNKSIIYIYIYEKSTTKTLYLKENTAIVELRYTKNPQYFGHFTLKKENGIWKLDKWNCGGIEECNPFYK